MTLQTSTENVLHPTQVRELKDEKGQVEGMLNAPPHIRALIQNPKGMVQRLRNADKMLEQAPEVIPDDQKDVAVRLEQGLRENWLRGMPTQAEMRKSPSGAVGRHMDWELRTKDDVLRWKNMRRRMQVSGMANDHDVDISNIERYRPVGGSQELNMDNPQIAGTDYHLPPPGAAPGVVLSDEQIALLKSIAPDVAEQLFSMDNEQRAVIAAALEPPKLTKVAKTRLCEHCGEQRKRQGFQMHQKACAKKNG